MITIIGRRLIVPDCDRVLGVTEDANTRIKIKLSSDTVERYFPDGADADSVGVTLVMEYEDGSAFPSVAFTSSKDGVHEGYVNLVGVNKTGILRARALLTYNEEVTSGDAVSTVTTSMQTEEEYFYISDEIEASDINKNGSTLESWSKTLEDIKTQKAAIDGAVDSARAYESSAKGYADDAKLYADNTSVSASVAATSKNEAVTAKNEAAFAKDEAVAAMNKAKEYSESVDLSNYAKKIEVFDESEFKWTDFEYTVPTEAAGVMGEVSDTQISLYGTGEPVVIHCAGRTIGFTFGISGWGDASIKINGETIVYSDPNNDGGEFASDVVIPLTYMESDIEFSGGMKTWTFSDMKCLTVKGIAELEEQIGDASAALDGILDIQNGLIGGDAV